MSEYQNATTTRLSTAEVSGPTSPTTEGHWWASPIQVAIREMESELRSLRAERDDYRQRWLNQVDANDKLRAQLASEATLGWGALGHE